MELNERDGDEISFADHASPHGSQLVEVSAIPATLRRNASRRQAESSLRDCARESAVRLIHLSPPLQGNKREQRRQVVPPDLRSSALTVLLR